MSELSAAQPAADGVVRSIHSVSFPPLLRQLGVSLFVSTYQAGKLLILRPDGDVVNVLCRDFESPMGLTYRDGELVLGSRQHVWTFLNNLHCHT